MSTTAVNMTDDRSLTLCDASGGAFTIVLPVIADSLGRVLNFKKTDNSANAVTIDGNGVETIDGELTQGLVAEFDCITITADESEWHIV